MIAVDENELFKTMCRVSFGILENPWVKVSSRAGDSLRVFAQFAPGYCNLGDASLSGL